MSLTKRRLPRLGRAAGFGLALGLVLLGVGVAPTSAMSEEMTEAGHQGWTFAGVYGHFDRAQLQRGFKIYKEVCSACHSMRQLKFRNLGDAGGPEFPEAAVKALAAEVEVDDIDGDGQPKVRPGRPADAFKSPYPNVEAARAANNGALPPDLSVIAKARAMHAESTWYLEPVRWVKDIATGYQEGGPDYINALLTGYQDAVPAGMKTEEGEPFVLADGMSFNMAYPGHQIAMIKPLSDGQVEYTDGTPATVDQYAKDVASFLMWAAEPKLEERKQLGLRVMIFLLITAVLFYLAKRMLWSRIGH